MYGSYSSLGKKFSPRRGNAAFSAVTIVATMGFGALAVDIGLVRVARTQLQTSLDAAALSGATELDGTAQGIGDAALRVLEYADYNEVLKEGVDVDPTNVEIGTWDADATAFTVWAPGEDPLTVNAVRVSHTVPAISAVLASVAFGIGGFQVEATSLAVRPPRAGPAEETECFLPFAVPDCNLRGLGGNANPEPFKFTFSPTPSDTVAWGDPSANPSSSGVRDQLLGQCEQGKISRGDMVFTNEGSHSSALQALADILNQRTEAETARWDPHMLGAMPARDGTDANAPKDSAVSTANWGTTLQGIVPLVDAGDNCEGVNFPGEFPITRFAWAVVYDVMDKGSSKNVYMMLDLLSPHDTWGEAGNDEGENADQNVLGTGFAMLVEE
jgi:hypothetical protein